MTWIGGIILAVTIGVISDTHGVVLEEIKTIFKGCHMIIHAGDIGCQSVIEILESIAPVFAVKGNIDKGIWAEKIPKDREIQIEDVNIYIIHNLKEIKINPKKEGFNIIISGHSHKYMQTIEDDVLYINPGGSGRKRFNLPLTVVELKIDKDKYRAEIKYL